MNFRASLARGAAAVAGILALACSPSFVTAQKPDLPVGDPARTWKEEDANDGRWNQMDVGPFLASVLNPPGGAIGKGLSLKVGERGEAAVCYDTATCALRCAWTGGFLEFNPRRYGITSTPLLKGDVQFTLSNVGWGQGRLPYRGLYQCGLRTVLKYELDGAEVLEHPWVATGDSVVAITRTLRIAPHRQPLALTLLENTGERTVVTPERHARYIRDRLATSIALVTVDAGVLLQTNRDSVILRIEPNDQSVRLALWMATCPPENAAAAEKLLSAAPPATDLSQLIGQPQSLWPKWFSTGGTLGEGAGPYVIDTVNLPFENAYKALLFTSGLGFFQNGDIAVCTMHGDVWLVRGVDDDLADVKWKRYATGLCQPLGLTIVDDKVYVVGKDQITRLHDTSGDDEADYYECFTNAGATSLGGHDFAACLETDPAGNFYYIRAHEGVCKVSADGKTHTSIATGFRNPIGLGVSPAGQVTAAPQEGEWTPSSALIAVRDGGYYGFGGPKPSAARPLGYDPPLCWIPRGQDNSSGGQVWVNSDKWGLPRGQMLHFSYGKCTALAVLQETVEDEHGTQVTQGGTVMLPLFFESGACRGRFSPHDGQLYACGLMGWQTAAAKDGCLQRVRYTGRTVNMPIGLHVKPQGIELTFTDPLDPKTAADPDNYFVEQWNYLYAGSYGSKEYRVSDPKKYGRDEVYVNEAKLSSDGRTVYLQLEEIAPVMQMAITCQLKSAAGDDVKHTIYNTINTVPAK